MSMSTTDGKVELSNKYALIALPWRNGSSQADVRFQKLGGMEVLWQRRAHTGLDCEKVFIV